MRGSYMLLLNAVFAVWHAMGACLPARADNWPQWRGPEGNSLSREQGLPLVFNPLHKLAWKAPLRGEGASTPVIWRNAVFVTSQEGQNLFLSRLDKATGKLVWERQVGTADVPRKDERWTRGKQKFHDLHNAASPSPVTDGEVVVAHFGNGDLAAYDFQGQQLWQRNLQRDHGAYTIWWGHANSPVIAGDYVISVCMQDSLSDLSEQPAPSYVVAHHRISGKQKWLTMRMTKAAAEQCDAYTTPLVYRNGSRLELIVMGGNQLDSYDAATGKQLWHLPNLVGGRTITGPTLIHGAVFATQGMRGPLFALGLRDFSGPVETRAIGWRHTEGTPDSCCPVVWDQLLFFVADNGVARCLDIANGSQKWTKRLKGDYKASPLAAEGRIYFLNTSGLCTVISATSRFELLAENEIGEPTIASPAVSDGKIFIRGKSHLFAFGE